MALASPLIKLMAKVSTQMNMVAKAIPTNNADYSCHIKAKKLILGINSLGADTHTNTHTHIQMSARKQFKETRRLVCAWFTWWLAKSQAFFIADSYYRSTGLNK